MCVALTHSALSTMALSSVDGKSGSHAIKSRSRKIFIVQVGWSADRATDIALNYANDFCSHYKFMKFYKFEF